MKSLRAWLKFCRDTFVMFGLNRCPDCGRQLWRGTCSNPGCRVDGQVVRKEIPKEPGEREETE